MSAPPTRSTGGNHRNKSLRLQLLPARAFFLLPLPQPDTRAPAVLVDELHPVETVREAMAVKAVQRAQTGGPVVGELAPVAAIDLKAGPPRVGSARSVLYLAGLACSMEEDMAKGQLRSNREKKKPKADKNKSKTSKPASPWVSTQFQPRATRPRPKYKAHFRSRRPPFEHDCPSFLSPHDLPGRSLDILDPRSDRCRIKRQVNGKEVVIQRGRDPPSRVML